MAVGDRRAGADEYLQSEGCLDACWKASAGLHGHKSHRIDVDSVVGPRGCDDLSKSQDVVLPSSGYQVD